jgi:pimeloyl-ACP methyl ester carboxylesterase
MAAELSRDHTVVVPDLRGMGLSSHPETGYEKKAQAHDIARVLDALKIDKAVLVTSAVEVDALAPSDQPLGIPARGGN